MSIYQIRVQGHPDERWKSVFAGFSFSHRLGAEGQPVTVLCGPVADQAALYGLVSRLRNLGVALISLQPVEEAGMDQTG